MHKDTFKYIVGKHFFPKYARKVKNWKNKMAGYSGRGKPIEFTEEDKIIIVNGVKSLLKDLTAQAGIP